MTWTAKNPGHYADVWSRLFQLHRQQERFYVCEHPALNEHFAEVELFIYDWRIRAQACPKCIERWNHAHELALEMRPVVEAVHAQTLHFRLVLKAWRCSPKSLKRLSRVAIRGVRCLRIGWISVWASKLMQNAEIYWAGGAKDIEINFIKFKCLVF